LQQPKIIAIDFIKTTNSKGVGRNPLKQEQQPFAEMLQTSYLSIAKYRKSALKQTSH